MKVSEKLKTWVEISRKAVKSNIKIFKTLVGKKTQLWAVVKSNAYGHGLIVFSKLADKAGVDGFCVDNVEEGICLRNAGIKKPILVLGPTLPVLFGRAKKYKITITISNRDALAGFLKSRNKPDFHLKIDSGMRRQGFYPEEVPEIMNSLKKARTNFKGVFTHFCAANDKNNSVFTDKQLNNFEKVLENLDNSGFKNLTRHAAATGAALIDKKYHLDAVRIGIGLYGLLPSEELNAQFSEIKLNPVFSWHAAISEIKDIKKGDGIGYDLTEKVTKNSRAAVLPIGYWHGLPRAFSSLGLVLINSKPAKILGRVSMDLIMADVTGIKCGVGDEAVIIGGQGDGEIAASEAAGKIGTNHYELITRVNPLIERIIK